MYLKIVFNFIVVIVITTVQISFISSLPSYFSNFNLLLLFLVYILIVSNLSTALNYAMSIGLIMDIFSFMPFGVYTGGFMISLVIVNFLLVNFFTNRSLYSFLALIAAASFLNFFVVAIINNIISFFFNTSFIVFNSQYFLSVFKQLALNSVFMMLIFYLTNFLNNSFRPVFLVNKKT